MIDRGFQRGGRIPDLATRSVLDAADADTILELAKQVRPRTTEYADETSRLHDGTHGWVTKPPDTLSFRTLRRIGERSVLNSAIHRRRADGIRGFTRRWNGQKHHTGWRVVHVAHHEPDFDQDSVDGLDARIRVAEQVLRTPHKVHAPNLHSLIAPVLQDHLVIDRAAINVIWDATRTRPVQAVHTDGATVLPVRLWADRYVQTNGYTNRYGQAPRSDDEVFETAIGRAYSRWGVDLSTLAYVQVLDESPEEPIAWLDERDVIVGIANPSPDIRRWGFGTSPCEGSWVASAIYLFGLGYTLDFYRNSLANNLAIVQSPSKRQELVEAFDVLRTQYSGAGNQHKTPFLVLPTGAKIDMLPTRAPARDMEVTETQHSLAMLTASFYSEPPESLNLTPRGPSSSSLSEPSRAEEQAIMRSEGLLNNGHWLAERMLTPLVQAIDEDLMVIWEGVQQEDEERQTQLRSQRFNAGWITFNEARQEEGREAWDEDWADKPKWLGTNMAQQQVAMEQQQQMAAMGAPPGAPGAPPGAGAPPAPGGPGGPIAPGENPAPPAPEPPDHLAWDQGGEEGKALRSWDP